MKLVGLTGGIATGKSLVSGELRRLGAKVLDADEIYHELLESSEELTDALRREFGPEYFDQDGHLDRRALGRLVFSDPEALARLNRITHPVVIDSLWDRVDELTMAGLPDGLLFLSIPLLFEARLDEMVDEIVVVWCREDLQVERLANRNHLTREEARVRLASQWPLERKRELATHVIDNSGSVEETLAQVRRLHGALRESAAG